MFKLTKAEALSIQAKQLDHFAAQYGDWIRDAVAKETHADMLPDEATDVVEVNRHIPRGGSIESLICRHIGHRAGYCGERCTRCNAKLNEVK